MFDVNYYASGVVEGITAEEIKAISEAQQRYCARTGFPFFAPLDGTCFYCRRQIFKRWTVEAAEKHAITGCPYCNHSYCD